MTMAAVDETWERLGVAAQLLHTAALAVWSHADQQEPESPLHALGLGVCLAQAQVTALLPADHGIPEPAIDRDADEPEEQDALQLLTSAEELTRSLPLHRPDLVGVSDLVVDLCDLIREARGLGY